MIGSLLVSSPSHPRIESNAQYCRSAKNILHQYTDAMKVYELDEMEDGGDIQAYLGEKTGQRTVPSIWIKQQFIGGSECAPPRGADRQTATSRRSRLPTSRSASRARALRLHTAHRWL